MESFPTIATSLAPSFIDDYSKHARTETEILKTLPIEVLHAIYVHNLYKDCDTVENLKSLKVVR